MSHPYLLEASGHRRDHIPPALSVSTSLSGHSTGLSTPVSQFTSSPRVVQPPASHLASHTACAFEASSSHRQSFYLTADLADPQYAHLLHAPGHKPQRPPPLQHSEMDSSLYPSAEPSPNSQNGWDGVQSPSQAEVPEEHSTDQPMDTTTSPIAPEFPSAEPAAQNGGHCDVPAFDSKLQKPSSSLPFRKQRGWRQLMFGNGDKSHLPPVDELHVISQSQGSTSSLKRTQSSSTDSRSLPEAQPSIAAAPPPKDPKKVKKEAARMAREAEMQRRAQMLKAQQEQSRAVMKNRNQIISESQTRQELEWKWQSHAHLLSSHDPSRFAGSEQHNQPRNGGGPIRDHPTHGDNAIGLGPYERMAKARRREFDDDHSMSSSDVRSTAISVMSFATNDSDPGPSSLRPMPSLFFSIREPSASSPLGFSDDFSVSGTSERSVSHHLTQASMESSSVSDLGSPPPLHNLSLSPSGSWQTLQQSDSADESVHQPIPSRLLVPSPRSELPYGGHIGGLSPSPGLSAPKSAINPIFKVVSDVSALS